MSQVIASAVLVVSFVFAIAAYAQNEKELLLEEVKVPRGTVIAACLKEKIQSRLIGMKDISDQRHLYNSKPKYFWTFDGKNSRFTLQIVGPAVAKKEAEQSIDDASKVYALLGGNCIDSQLRKYVGSRTSVSYHNEKTGDVIA